MPIVSEKLSQAKESLKFIYKQVTKKSFFVEIIFWCEPKYESSFFHFEKVASIIDSRLEKCLIGKQGEFIAKYRVKAEDRDEATDEALKVYKLISENLGENFTLKHYRVV